MPKHGGGMPGYGGMNMNNLMKQAKQMQKQMEEMQTEMETKTLEITSGGGAVKVVVNGKKQIKELTVSKDVVDPDDVEMLQDLILSAVNEALRQMDELTKNQMSQLTGGMNLPGGLF
ncbi:MAG: YbaB/EbfC family nucleoid-associated protein [Clostridiales bacterium]|jgi:DNA-binding YbaB/EbfC family protein|nr:YbaB/EbfC family nucleoid-associated protein [Clostridiales bacterium]